jgi:hypothetical protein
MISIGCEGRNRRQSRKVLINSTAISRQRSDGEIVYNKLIIFKPKMSILFLIVYMGQISRLISIRNDEIN